MANPDSLIDMGDLIEAKIIERLLAEPGLKPVNVWFQGEPGPIPTRAFPMGTLFLEIAAEATGEDGFGQSTGMRYYYYDGYASIDVIHRDAPDMGRDLAKGVRTVSVPSYKEARQILKFVANAFLQWGGVDGRRIEEDPVVSVDGKATTVGMVLGDMRWGMARRRDNVSNHAALDFRIYVRVLDFT